jgi:GTP-binding protein
MRREGYEVIVSRPTVIYKDIDGKRCEPFERILDRLRPGEPRAVMENLARRKAQIREHAASTPAASPWKPGAATRGLIGFEFDLANQTSGRGVMSRLFDGYRRMWADVVTRQTGALISTEFGTGQYLRH